MNKVNSFVKSFVAIVTGDDSTARAEKAKRQADSALKTHISILKGDLVNKEDAVSAAAEAEQNAVVNGGNPITNRDSYVQELFSAKNRLTLAEQDLKKHQEKIAFLEGKLAGLDTEVEA
jgi:hypothetical protein